jgi:hypothetical protein
VNTSLQPAFFRCALTLDKICAQFVDASVAQRDVETLIVHHQVHLASVCLVRTTWTWTLLTFKVSFPLEVSHDSSSSAILLVKIAFNPMQEHSKLQRTALQTLLITSNIHCGPIYHYMQYKNGARPPMFKDF